MPAFLRFAIRMVSCAERLDALLLELRVLIVADVLEFSISLLSARMCCSPRFVSSASENQLLSIFSSLEIAFSGLFVSRLMLGLGSS